MASVLLISTYELGHQPFGLASPAAWLRNAGADVHCLDLAVQPLDENLVLCADLIAIYLPMHTASRLAARLIPRLKDLNARALLCCFGLYAPANEEYLRRLGVHTIIGGEFEPALVELLDTLSPQGSSHADQSQSSISLERLDFQLPDRSLLPALDDYAQLIGPDGSRRLAGYTEASRGCKHLCRHCPIVPVYNGRFRIVQKEIVLADIRQQVEAGAQHITFGDPDFFNGPGHALPIVEALHEEFPALTYDVTIKIEHLLKYDHLLPTLRDTGCLFITSAVESVDDHVLERLDKRHTRQDFVQAVYSLRQVGLLLNPTFVTFSPWTTAAGYLDMLSLLRELDLIDQIAPIQYAIRLLIPSGSKLLQLEEIVSLVGPFDPQAFCYPWQHPDPAIDKLYERVFHLVRQSQKTAVSRPVLFESIWQTVLDSAPELRSAFPEQTTWDLAAKPVPRLSESWY
ncbi:MAG: CUAEP/CCAEP-tail radical SAM (seleno)protein [Candidatus Promineifilaceae bacterium]